MLYLERVNLGLENQNPLEMGNFGVLDDFDSIATFEDRSDISSAEDFDEDGIIECSGEEDNLLNMGDSSSRHFGTSGNPFKRKKSGAFNSSSKNSQNLDLDKSGLNKSFEL